MIDKVVVFNKGGLVLWSKQYFNLKGNPIDAFIKTVLLQERSSSENFSSDNYIIKWTLSNELELVFAVVYSKMLQLLYIDDLLRLSKEKFIKIFSKEKIMNGEIDGELFEKEFEKIMNNLESKSINSSSSSSTITTNNTPKKTTINKTVEEVAANSASDSDSEEENKTNENNQSNEPNDISLEAMSFKSNKTNKAPKHNHNKKQTKEPTTPTKTPIIPTGKYSAKAAKALDRSQPNSTDSSSNASQYLISTADTSKFDNPDEDEEDETEEKKPKGKLYSLFDNITGNKVLEEGDIMPVMAKFKEILVTKNVAQEIAQKLCDSVSSNLIGKKLGSFKSVSSTIKGALQEALERILTPKRNIDILREIFAAKDKGKPYSIVFVGVNGVGKSTNLSKVCYWLLQNNLKVMIAACDTFRSGAVEQIKVHARNLGVHVFERGYNKDAGIIAKEAIAYARNEKYDVVLIDTAGRMQDNAPLMQSLSKLINLNKPDLILFVGEALVGNDGVDQLVKFNQALADLSTDDNPRLIDGTILTKFDTIDDKVGAAISMVYTTGQPIVFVGIGQAYPDLRKLNIKTVVNSLLN